MTAPPPPPPDVRPAGAPDRFVTTVEGLIFLGSSHGGDEAADFGPFRYGRLRRGEGSLVRFDMGAIRFARYVAPTNEAPGYWLVDPTLIDYFEGDERARLAEVDATAAFAFIEAGAPTDSDV